MAATVTVTEQNGTAPGTRTDSITTTNMGSTDAVNLDPSTYPITAGANSYEKWQRFRVTVAGGSSQIKNLKIWASAVLATAATLYTNAATTKATYLNPTSSSAYRDPVATASTAATYTMPITTPASANVGIQGNIYAENYINLAGTLPASSDYFVTQIKTSSDAVAGTTVTMNYQYDEIA